MPAMPTSHLLGLQPFPNLPSPSGISIVAGAEPLPGGALRLGFVLNGTHEALSRILIPESSSPIRVDGLWQRTCCEAFIGVPGSTVYREFNFSPSGAWAAYAFSDYRRAAALPIGPVPPIAFIAEEGTLTLATTLAASWLPKAPQLCIGLSVVIETVDGERSYWALAHPAGQPDFHHRDSFTLALETRQDACLS